MINKLRQIHKGANYFLLLLFAFVLLVAFGCTGEDVFTLEQRAFVLDSQILCPVCDGQSIAESQAQIAQDLRQVVRERLAAGDSNADVLDFVVARYGEGIVGSPNAGNFWGLLAWLAPGIVVFIGLIVLGVVLFNIKRRNVLPLNLAAEANTTTASNSTDSAQTKKYVEMVEREIAQRALAKRKGDTNEG